MATKTLVEKIESLPPEKRAQVEEFVDALTKRNELAGEETAPAKAAPDELFRQIHERRERLRSQHGLFPDSTEIIRELRESGS